MAPLAPPFAALLKQALPAPPIKPVAQVTPDGFGAGSGMATPPRMQYSPTLAALIKSRQQAAQNAPVGPTNLNGFARGR